MPPYTDPKGQRVDAQQLAGSTIPAGVTFDERGPHIISILGRMSVLEGDWVVTDQRLVQRVYDPSEFARLFTPAS